MGLRLMRPTPSGDASQLLRLLCLKPLLYRCNRRQVWVYAARLPVASKLRGRVSSRRAFPGPKEWARLRSYPT